MRRQAKLVQHLINDLDYEIRRTARTQRVPGMTPDEIRSEMYEALWRAQQTFDPALGKTIAQYWWSIWLNRKADLISYYFAAKRDVRQEILFDGFWNTADDESVEHPVLYIDQVLIPPAPTADPIARKVWYMIADGYTRKDIIEVCEISRRTYYAIIQSFKDANTLKEVM